MTNYAACRTLEKAEEAIMNIQKETKLGNHLFKPAELNLSSMKNITKFADSFKDKNIPLDSTITALSRSNIIVLINNAGIFPSKYRYTEDGLEESMAVNYLGHFLLTSALFDSLAHQSTIINVSSDTYRYTT